MKKRAVFLRGVRGGIYLLLGAWLTAALLYALDPVALPMPVEGLSPRRAQSSFHAPRPNRRRHQGIDLFARRGTPVHAAGWGVVVKVGRNRLGGNVVFTIGRRGLLCYYAHLLRPSSVHVGQVVTAETVLGHVGTTGNARGKSPHLHFETRPLALGLRAVDPHPLLTL